MKKIIFDCDNTAGIQGYPMDDALAFLYLWGNRHEAEILGFTCTFGNGTAAQVYECSRRLLAEIRADGEIPLFRGAERGENPAGESARFIADMAGRYPGEAVFLGIGSVTNLYGAYLLDPALFEKLGGVILMGGVTKPLYPHGKFCPELNFSVNCTAAAGVLSHGRNIAVITGNNCLDASYLPKAEFMARMRVQTDPTGAYIAEKCGSRFDARKDVYGEEGSYCWDAVAAAYVLHPELFDENWTRCAVSEERLKRGDLAPDPAGGALLNLPRVRDPRVFREHLYAGWLNAGPWNGRSG